MIVVAIVAFLIIDAFVKPEPRLLRPRKGTAASLVDPKLLAGHYYKGDGMAHYHLDLNVDMTYRMVLWGEFGIDGQSTGAWSLTNSRVLFHPAEQTGTLARSRKELNVLRFEQHWILVPEGKSSHEYYEEMGVSQYTCFQDTNFIFWGP